MNITQNYANTPVFNAAQTVEDTIARFSSLEQRRIALRKALQSRPNDPRLSQAIEKMTSPYQLRKAAQQGLFVSYARVDEIFALELAVALRKLGYSAWLDMIDGGNEDWNGEVQQALRGSGLMLAVLSPKCLLDRAVRAERDRFQRMGKLIVPIIHRPLDMSSLDYWVMPVDFSKDFDFGLHQLQQTFSAAATV